MQSPILALSVSQTGRGAALANIQIAGDVAHTRTVRPGQTFEGIILVKNTGSEGADVRINQSDFASGADAQSANPIDAGSRAEHSAAPEAWLSITPSTFRIPAHGTVPVRYRCRVPTGAGSYWSMVMLEPATQSAQLPDVQDRLAENRIGQLGIRSLTDVENRSVRNIRVLDGAMAADSDFQLLVENTGEKAIAPKVHVALSSADGVCIGTFDAHPNSIAPCSSSRFQVDLSGISPGRYAALVLVEHAGASVAAGPYDIDLAA